MENLSVSGILFIFEISIVVLVGVRSAKKADYQQKQKAEEIRKMMGFNKKS